ncbi:MAG: 5'-methylthioadenosine/S-adenosylhomocysteine nucleosidase [Pseudomonadota bacterium]
MSKLLDNYDCVIITALVQELPAEDLPLPIYYSGIGKINAAMTTMQIIQQLQPKIIINYGTAGSVRNDLSGIVRVEKVIQHDIDLRELGFQLGETPFEEDSLEIKLDKTICHLPGLESVTCASGDQFMTKAPELKSDIVDMEAYAIAKICRKYQTGFCCFKYISDNANESANDDWQANIEKGIEKFKALLAQIVAA